MKYFIFINNDGIKLEKESIEIKKSKIVKSNFARLVTKKTLLEIGMETGEAKANLDPPPSCQCTSVISYALNLVLQDALNSSVLKVKASFVSHS